MVERTVTIKYYIGALSHLRRASGRFVSEILRQSEVLPYEYIDLTTYDKLKLVERKNMLEKKEIDFLHEIWQTGNEAVHGAVANSASTQRLINLFKEYFHQWIGK